MKRTNYEIVEMTPERVVIRDLGPWHKYLTITNGAEGVVDELYKQGKLVYGQKLFYYDSEGRMDEITHQNGSFTGFKAG